MENKLTLTEDHLIMTCQDDGTEHKYPIAEVISMLEDLNADAVEQAGEESGG